MNLEGYVNCGLFMIGGISGALVLVALIRSVFSASVLRSAHEVTGHLLAVTGTLYAVTLGMIVVDAMARFEQAADTVQQESNCLVETFEVANRLPEPYRSRLQKHCREYAASVVQKEWSAMAAGRGSPETRAAMMAINRSLDGYEPRSEVEKAMFPLLVEQISELWRHRRERLGTAANGIPAIEWLALVVGAVITVAFTGLFTIDHTRLHVLVTAMVAMAIGLNLYLVSLFGYPFAGDLSVSVEPLRHDLAIFTEWDEGGPGSAATSPPVQSGR
ncbi:MAG: hypothetical protein ACOYK7_16665 [Pirellulales bacterium]